MSDLRGLPLLRDVMQDAGNDDRPPFAPDRMRFVLERPGGDDTPGNHEPLRARIAALLESDRFTLVPLFGEAGEGGVEFVVFAPDGVDRTLPDDAMYGIADALRDRLGLLSCEPDIGASAYSDPSETPPPGTEGVVGDIFCWVQGRAPDDREWALRKTFVHEAWARSPGKGAGIVVAQPDTGIAGHAELADTVIDRARTLNLLEGGSDPADPLSPRMSNPGHGTGTCSVVASGEGGAIKGSAPGATMVPIRCINDVKIFDGSPVARAVDHALSVGADVITMSLGGVWSRSLRAAIRRAASRDCIVLAAAGNCVGLTVWPAAFPETIAVAGTGPGDLKWKGSSSGPSVAFSAPAEFVWRADRKDASGDETLISGGQGTSFAVALSAGIAALWLGHHGRAAVAAEARRRGTVVQEMFRAATVQTARRPPSFPTGMGAGIVNADALLALPLRDIRMSTPESAIAARLDPSGGLTIALAEVLGPGVPDEGFDWARHGAEVSAMLIADARAGRGTPGAGAEARAPRRVSAALAEAAAGSADPRLAALALRAGISAPALLRPAPDDRVAAALLTRLGPFAGAVGGAEAARSIAPEAAQAMLDAAGRARITGGARARLESAGRSDLLGDLDRLDATLERLHRQGTGTGLTARETIELEALVSLTERPAVPVTERETPDRRVVQTVDATDPSFGRFAVPVELSLPTLETGPLAAVGRIDGGDVHVGTGFLVAAGLVMTNRHVLEDIASPVPRAEDAARWQLTREATIDFSPSGYDPAQRFRVTEVAFAGPRPILGYPIDFGKLDLALLAVETTNVAGNPLPVPITVTAKGAGWRGAAGNLYVVGYPAPPVYVPRDENGRLRRDVIDRLAEIFGVRYREKFFSPGVVQAFGPSWVFDHDATTLGGNSGSLVGVLEGDRGAVGLHFAGDWLRANHGHDLGAVRAADAVVDGLLP